MPSRSGRARAALAVFAGLLAMAGCSEPTEDYCAALADERSRLQRLSSQQAPGTGSLTSGLEAFERLRDAAPDDVHDEWVTFVNAWQGLVDTVDTTGVDPKAFESGRPDDVDPQEYDAVRDAAETLRSRPVVEASLGIEQHAADVCGVDLGGVVG